MYGMACMAHDHHACGPAWHMIIVHAGPLGTARRVLERASDTQSPLLRISCMLPSSVCCTLASNMHAPHRATLVWLPAVSSAHATPPWHATATHAHAAHLFCAAEQLPARLCLVLLRSRVQQPLHECRLARQAQLLHALSQRLVCLVAVGTCCAVECLNAQTSWQGMYALAADVKRFEEQMASSHKSKGPDS